MNYLIKKLNMHTRKKLNNKYIFHRNIDISNEKILFKDKLQIEEKSKKMNLENNNNSSNKKYFLKDQEIQNNSINEEDDYNIDVYNNSLSKEDNFLNEIEKDEKYQTIQVNNYFKRVHKNFLQFSKKKIYNNYNPDFSSTSTEFNNILRLKTTDDNEKIADENQNYLMSNINQFKLIHKERKDTKLFNQILEVNNHKSKYINDFEKNKNIISNKVCKKFKKKQNLELDNNNGIIIHHKRLISQPFNGPYLRKNKIIQLNKIKNANKNMTKIEYKPIINTSGKEIHSQNISRVQPVTKTIFNRYSQIDTNICDKKLYTTKENNDKEDSNNKNKNKKKKIIISSFYDIKRNDSLSKNSVCTCHKDHKEKSYIFNLKFYNIYNNNKQNNNKIIKSKSNSKTNDYFSFDENYINNDINVIKQKEVIPKNKIYKKKVIFEEEYIIDSNGNQKFLCVKRVGDDNCRNEQSNNNNIQESNGNKRALTSNNILSPSKTGDSIKMKISNLLNSSNIRNNESYIKKKNKKRRIEAKTVFCSPQLSYENIFAPNNNLTNSRINISDIKNSKTNFWTNINRLKEERDMINSKSCNFISAQNSHFYEIDNNNNKNEPPKKIIKISSLINKKIANEGKNKSVSEFNKISFNKAILPKKKYKKIDIEKANNNSRNYNTNDFININDYSNKEKPNINNFKSKVNKIENIYKTTNYEKSKIYIPILKFPNISERNNFKYHEINSVSKEKANDEHINYSNNSKKNNLYFDSKNKYQKIIPYTSMDNIKMEKKLYSKIDNSYLFQIKNKLDKNSKKSDNQSTTSSKRNNILYFSQEFKKNEDNE